MSDAAFETSNGAKETLDAINEVLVVPFQTSDGTNEVLDATKEVSDGAFEMSVMAQKPQKWQKEVFFSYYGLKKAFFLRNLASPNNPPKPAKNSPLGSGTELDIEPVAQQEKSS